MVKPLAKGECWAQSAGRSALFVNMAVSFACACTNTHTPCNVCHIISCINMIKFDLIFHSFLFASSSQLDYLHRYFSLPLLSSPFPFFVIKRVSLGCLLESKQLFMKECGYRTSGYTPAENTVSSLRNCFL